jgi:hypothetical protein
MKKACGWTVLGLASVLALSGACRPRVIGRDAGVQWDAGTADAGTVVPLQLTIEVPLTDGGTIRQPLDLAAAPFVPVTRALLIAANLPLRNYRLRILDELDRTLASDDVPEDTLAGLRYQVVLLAPLRLGHRYTVLLDAQSGVTLDDGNGRALPEQRFEFRTEGERERDTPPKRINAKHRHRRGDGK